MAHSWNLAPYSTQSLITEKVPAWVLHIVGFVSKEPEGLARWKVADNQCTLAEKLVEAVGIPLLFPRPPTPPLP